MDTYRYRIVGSDEWDEPIRFQGVAATLEQAHHIADNLPYRLVRIILDGRVISERFGIGSMAAAVSPFVARALAGNLPAKVIR